ncbi:leader peptidase (prepilin peptidase)/N-methyltransferase [Scopulibacillus darangshiensis]|uniref:Leader peptidase (Prepilin peptidase)/N-methyltransferase n=1 Tax=Scopulibacillus darangshiensis TaxID=442528 RepID=A0A4R2PDP6_9BACL|nr:A24 family peptidase [Scopulibacillus darangshiensis]TCP32231.1 leader peptidase (prepilin peptidase)/N-methyltransferase [Scopulibacillus darangshiensis]
MPASLMIINYMSIFLVGLVLGSFYNVVGLRSVKGESVIFPGSYCYSCGRKLTYLEMVPVFSYFLLKGQCKSCNVKISPLYPILEFLTGLLFAVVFVAADSLSYMYLGWLLFSLLLIITVSDLKAMMIPDKVLFVFLLIFIFYRIIIPMTPWWGPILGFCAGFLLLNFIYIISRGNIGGGDIKLFAVIGILTGWQQVLLIFFFAVICGTMFSLVGLASGRFRSKQAIPFGPFIFAGSVICYFFGEHFLEWYISFLG